MIIRKPHTICTAMEIAEIDMLMEKKGRLCLLDRPIYKHDENTNEDVMLEAGSPVYIVETRRDPGCVALTIEDASGGRWMQYMSDMDAFYQVFNPLHEKELAKYIPESNPKGYKSRKRFCKLAACMDSALPSVLIGPAMVILSVLLYVVANSATMQNMTSIIPSITAIMATISLVYGLVQIGVGYTAFFMFFDSDYAWYAHDEIFLPELHALLQCHNITWVSPE